MSNRKDLIKDIERKLKGFPKLGQLSSSSLSDLFEVYIFSLIIQAAMTEGAKISYWDIDRNKPSSLIFRTSPGFISSRARPYTYASITFTNKPQLEAHVGVYVAGKSHVFHECDVAVLYATEAVTCRRNPGVIPRHTRLIIGVECKHYASNIPLSLGRGFLGLDVDMSYKFGDRYFVINTASPSVEKLLSWHKKDWDHKIYPKSPINVDRLRNAFQKSFQNYKARN